MRMRKKFAAATTTTACARMYWIAYNITTTATKTFPVCYKVNCILVWLSFVVVSIFRFINWCAFEFTRHKVTKKIDSFHLIYVTNYIPICKLHCVNILFYLVYHFIKRVKKRRKKNKNERIRFWNNTFMIVVEKLHSWKRGECKFWATIKKSSRQFPR